MANYTHQGPGLSSYYQQSPPVYGGGHSPGPCPPNFYPYPPQYHHHHPGPPPRGNPPPPPAALTAPEGTISNRPHTSPTTQPNTTLRHTTTHLPTPPFLPRLGSTSTSSLYRRYPNSCRCRYPSPPKTFNGIRNPPPPPLQTPPPISSSYPHIGSISTAHESSQPTSNPAIAKWAIWSRRPQDPTLAPASSSPQKPVVPPTSSHKPRISKHHPHPHHPVLCGSLTWSMTPNDQSSKPSLSVMTWS